MAISAIPRPVRVKRTDAEGSDWGWGRGDEKAFIRLYHLLVRLRGEHPITVIVQRSADGTVSNRFHYKDEPGEGVKHGPTTRKERTSKTPTTSETRPTSSPPSLSRKQKKVRNKIFGRWQCFALRLRAKTCVTTVRAAAASYKNQLDVTRAAQSLGATAPVDDSAESWTQIVSKRQRGLSTPSSVLATTRSTCSPRNTAPSGPGIGGSHFGLARRSTSPAVLATASSPRTPISSSGPESESRKRARADHDVLIPLGVTSGCSPRRNTQLSVTTHRRPEEYVGTEPGRPLDAPTPPSYEKRSPPNTKAKKRASPTSNAGLTQPRRKPKPKSLSGS